jgi:hypothetical protein
LLCTLIPLAVIGTPVLIYFSCVHKSPRASKYSTNDQNSFSDDDTIIPDSNNNHYKQEMTELKVLNSSNQNNKNNNVELNSDDDINDIDNRIFF